MQLVARRTLLLVLPAALTLLLLAVVAPAGADPGRAGAGTPDEAILVTAPSGPGAGALAALGDGYLSPVTAAPRPYTHLLLRWEASVPPGADLHLEVRASLDGDTWTPWGDVLANPDLWVPEDGDQIFWGQELYAGEGARHWQVRARLAPAPDGAAPALRQVNVYTVDARYGPADPAPDSRAEPAAAISALPARPPVVSRTAWGSPDGQGSRVAPKYRTARHMVVHHTADSNSLTPGQRWSDRVRAIWSFHALSRGWGDIGYNYLIDPNGVVYEGRAGGDDAVGFHDTANYGSMGVALIGTYEGAPPPGAASESLVALLAWKAGHRDIDPMGRSYYYGCSASEYCRPHNPGAIVSNIAGHRHVTPGRTSCPGDSLEAMLPEIRQRVRERLGGAPAPSKPSVDLLAVNYERTTVAAGELLKLTFVVRNTGAVAIVGQSPEAPPDPVTGAPNLADSYAYDEAECFLGTPGASYPVFPKESGRFRITLGPVEEGRQPVCAGGSGGYPWRWGLNGSLAPGEVREVVGYLRLRTPGTFTLRAGLVHEYVAYHADGFAPTTITVTPERQAPALAAYDEQLQPVAQVFRLGAVPAGFLDRAADATTPVRGALVGSFQWRGDARDWADGGPLPATPGLVDGFVVEQTRAFFAPSAGSYSFQVAADDGGWLWVDGQQVVRALRAEPVQTGAVRLAAGYHTLTFRAYDLGGASRMGYAMQAPGESGHGPVADAPGLAGGAAPARVGATFRTFPGLALGADDPGGGGHTVRVSINGGPWVESKGEPAQLGPQPDGLYTARYHAVDAAGNVSEERAISWRVDSALTVHSVALPKVR